MILELISLYFEQDATLFIKSMKIEYCSVIQAPKGAKKKKKKKKKYIYIYIYIYIRDNFIDI